MWYNYPCIFSVAVVSGRQKQGGFTLQYHFPGHRSTMCYLTYFILLICGKLTLCGVIKDFTVDKKLDKQFKQNMLATIENYANSTEHFRNCQKFPISNLSLLDEECDIRQPNLSRIKLNEIPLMCFSVVYNIISLCTSEDSATPILSLDDVMTTSPCDKVRVSNMTCEKTDDGCRAVKGVVGRVFGATESCKKFCVDEGDVRPVCKFLVATLDVLSSAAGDKPDDTKVVDDSVTGDESTKCKF